MPTSLPSFVVPPLRGSRTFAAIGDFHQHLYYANAGNMLKAIGHKSRGNIVAALREDPALVHSVLGNPHLFAPTPGNRRLLTVENPVFRARLAACGVDVEAIDVKRLHSLKYREFPVGGPDTPDEPFYVQYYVENNVVTFDYPAPLPADLGYGTAKSQFSTAHRVIHLPPEFPESVFLYNRYKMYLWPDAQLYPYDWLINMRTARGRADLRPPCLIDWRPEALKLDFDAYIKPLMADGVVPRHPYLMQQSDMAAPPDTRIPLPPVPEPTPVTLPPVPEPRPAIVADSPPPAATLRTTPAATLPPVPEPAPPAGGVDSLDDPEHLAQAKAAADVQRTAPGAQSENFPIGETD